MPGVGGSCLCGAVRYEITGTLRGAEICHCGMCRKAHGTPFSTNAELAAADVRIVAGEAELAEYASSPARRKVFCRRCGSHVLVRRLDDPSIVVVTMGTLDGDPGVRPGRHVFVDSRAAWLDLPADGLPRFRVYPGHEPAESSPPPSKRWDDFAAETPAMAAAGRTLVYQFRVGLGYLATVRKDGGPRVHPVCPVIANGGLYVFVGNRSPKHRDLLRDGRFALHAFPNPQVDDEFAVQGRASRVDDADVRRIVYEAYTATGAFTGDDTLFELRLERALHATYGPRPSWPPVYTTWSAAGASGAAPPDLSGR